MLACAVGALILRMIGGRVDYCAYTIQGLIVALCLLAVAVDLFLNKGFVPGSLVLTAFTLVAIWRTGKQNIEDLKFEEGNKAAKAKSATSATPIAPTIPTIPVTPAAPGIPRITPGTDID